MPMTLDQIVEESKRLPKPQIAELVDRLTLSLHQAVDSRVESAWREVVADRVAEIRAGTVEGIEGSEVTKRIAKIVGS